MTNYKKTKKLDSSSIQYGNAYKILGKQEDDLSTIESRKHLTKAQVEAQKLVQDALIQVEQTINQAQMEAAQILEQAKQDAVNIQSQAQETGQQLGYDTGYQAGYNQAVEEAANIITSAETIINGAYQSQKDILMNTEREMLGLIRIICKKILHKELKMQPDIILRLTEAAIKELKDRDEVRLMVNPRSVQLLKKASPVLVKRINSLEVLKIIEDKSIPVGGVIVESVSGKIDARVDTQLEEIYNKLVDEAAVNPVMLDLPQPKTLPTENLKDLYNPKEEV